MTDNARKIRHTRNPAVPGPAARTILKLPKPRFGLDVTFYCRENLASEVQSEKIQRFLTAFAPAWAAGLVSYIDRGTKRRIDARVQGSLLQELDRLCQRGERYLELVRRFGRPPYERRNGSGEFRGANSALTIVINVDEWPFHRIHESTQIGNSIALQIRSPRFEGGDSVEWVRRAMKGLCQELQPIWASSRAVEEYHAKNMCSDEEGIRAVGRDFARYLPGIYWLNFFGEPYQALIQREKLLSTPAHEVVDLGSGVLISLAAHPSEWDSPTYLDSEQKVLAHLGPQFFFSRQEPDRPTQAPRFPFGQASRR